MRLVNVFHHHQKQQGMRRNEGSVNLGEIKAYLIKNLGKIAVEEKSLPSPQRMYLCLRLSETDMKVTNLLTQRRLSSQWRLIITQIRRDPTLFITLYKLRISPSPSPPLSEAAEPPTLTISEATPRYLKISEAIPHLLSYYQKLCLSSS